MTDISQGEKTQKATAKKRRDERRKGHIFQSKDITSAIGLLLLFLFFQVTAKYYYAYLNNYFIHSFTTVNDIGVLTVASAKIYLAEFAVRSLLISLPFLLVAATVGVFFHFAQTRMNFSVERLKPDFSKLNPLAV